MRPGEWVPRVAWPRQGTAGRAAYAALRPMSEVFGLAVAVRNLAYRLGLLRTQRAAVPVVSVGNLVVGGTGKTPFTLWLARSLVARGRRPGILLRGYGGSRSGVNVVSRGSGPETDPEQVGDEAVMLAKAFAGPVVAAARRIDGAAALVDLGCDMVVLDDGFQHRAVYRDFDVVLFDGRRGPLLPAGPLRERLGALARADAVVLVERDEGALEVPPIAAGKLVCRMHRQPVSLVEAVERRWRERSLGELAGKRVVAVVGVAQPQSFYRLLRDWDAVILDVFEFPDHHRYTREDWKRIAQRGHQADLIVTTEKDLVKLEAFPFATDKLVALRIAPEVDRGEELISAILARAAFSTGAGGTG